MENLHGFAHGELQRLVDIESVVANLEDAALVARALALFAHQLDVGQELHLDGHRAIALADLAAPARDVEREVSGGVSALLRFARGGEQPANYVEGFDVRHGVGARRAPDGRLVDHDGARDSLRALDFSARRRRSRGEISFGIDCRFGLVHERPVKHVVDQRRFSRSRDARDGHHHAQGNFHIEVLQVMRARP